MPVFLTGLPHHIPEREHGGYDCSGGNKKQRAIAPKRIKYDSGQSGTYRTPEIGGGCENADSRPAAGLIFTDRTSNDRDGNGSVRASKKNSQKNRKEHERMLGEHQTDEAYSGTGKRQVSAVFQTDMIQEPSFQKFSCGQDGHGSGGAERCGFC